MLACPAQVSLGTASTANHTISRTEGWGWHHRKVPVPGQSPLQQKLNEDVVQILYTKAHGTWAQ